MKERRVHKCLNPKKENADYIAKIAEGKKEPLRLWVREDAVIEDIPNVIIKKLTPFVKYQVSETLSVTAMPANHNQNFYPQHFIFERNGKKFCLKNIREFGIGIILVLINICEFNKGI